MNHLIMMDRGIVHYKDIELVVLLDHTVASSLRYVIERATHLVNVLDIQRLGELRHKSKKVRTIHALFKNLIAKKSFVTDSST